MEAEQGSPELATGRYIVVKALEDGVTIMGLTLGRDTRSHHSERLDAGEVMIAQFTELTAAISRSGARRRSTPTWGASIRNREGSHRLA